MTDILNRLIEASGDERYIRCSGTLYIIYLPIASFYEHVVIPDIQRNVANDRVDEFEAIYRKQQETTGRIDTHVFHIAICDNTVNLIDGQHRARALRRVVTADSNIAVTIRVQVVESRDAMFELFGQLNNNRASIVEQSADRQCKANDVIAHLLKKFPAFQSASSKCHRPQFNVDVVLAHMKQYKFTERMIATGVDMLDAIDEINTFYADMPVDKWYTWKHSIPGNLFRNCKRSDKTNPFMLGVFKQAEWMLYILQKHEDGLLYSNMIHKPISVTTSRSVPAALRAVVWRKYHATDTGACYCCSKVLAYGDMQAGHVLAKSMGGRNEASNLEPVCATCNLDMNTENLYHYKTRVYGVEK